MRTEPVLECQDCGAILRHLTAEEAAEVAVRPYDFIRYCWACRRDRERGEL